MSDVSRKEKQADLTGIKECLSYVGRELMDKDHRLAARLVGAAVGVLEQEIAALKQPYFERGHYIDQRESEDEHGAGDLAPRILN